MAREKQHRNKSKMVTFWVTEDEKAALEEVAADLDRSMSWVVRHGIDLVRAEQATR